MLLHRLLSPSDDVADFECGVDSLNHWLSSNAARSHRQGVVRVYVWVVEDEPQRVLGYAAVQPTQIASSGLSRAQAGGHTTVPGYLIARLALDQSLHGIGLGAELLVGMLQVCVDAAHIGGGRVIAVEPIDDAATEFYERFGFVPTKGPSSRMLMKVSTAAAALERDQAPSS